MQFLPAIMASAALVSAAPHSVIAKSHSAGTREPTENEMRVAVQRGFDRAAIVAGRMAMGCHETRELAAMMIPSCILGSLNIVAGPYRARIISFDKVGCAPATNGEFCCSYHMSVIAPGAIDNVSLILNEHPTRFRYTRYGWEAPDISPIV
jgi:hypothetical protein